MIIMEFNRRLQQWIVSVYGTQLQFSSIVQMSKTTINRYISGEQEPKLSFFLKLGELGCDLNWLLRDDLPTVLKDRNNKSGAVMDSAIPHLRQERSKDELRKEIARLNNEVVEKNNQLYQIIENSDSHFVKENKYLREEIEQLKEKLKFINELSQI